MIITTFSNQKAIEINGKRYKPGASYSFTNEEWASMYERSFFKVETVKEETKSKQKKDNERISKSNNGSDSSGVDGSDTEILS